MSFNGPSAILIRSILSGLLLAAAWPAIGGITPLAFIAWVPLLDVMHIFLAKRRNTFAFFLVTWVTMLTWNFSTTYWLFLVSEPMSTKLFSLLGPNIANALLMTIPWVLAWKVHHRLGRLRGNVALVFYWIAFEYLHMNWDLQWPWLTMGNLFATAPDMVQWYSMTGVLGGSLWVLIANMILHTAWQRSSKTDVKHSMTAIAWALMALLTPLVMSWIVKVNVDPEEDDPVAELVLVQPNVDPYIEKFGGIHPMQQLEHMLDMAEKEITSNTDAVILPETALQENATCGLSGGELILHGLWENDLEGSQSVDLLRRFIDSSGVKALVGGMSSAYLLEDDDPLRASSRPLRGSGRYYEAYNAALLVGRGGKLDVYHKSKLVPGVELLPFEDVLGSLEFLSVDLGGTTGSLGVQEERTVFHVNDQLRIAPVICYESIYGEFVAGYVRNRANLITVITNDGWWDTSPAYLQHLHYARLRAIETRRDVVRSANTGISCRIDRLGRITESSSWWKSQVLRVRAVMNDDLTFYAKHGDWLGRAAVLLGAIMWLYALVVRMRAKTR